MAARGDVLAGKADDLSEFHNRLTLGDDLRRHLVSALDACRRRYAFDGAPRGDGIDGHDDVVARIEPQRTRSRRLRLVLHGCLPRLLASCTIFAPGAI